ncbi:MAG: pyridoxal-phosphate dependent enzyme [Spirochaetaceae bacterium]|nr:MAG: pyridoxal-phosphate dependent enzyme [Spirochaetaceae bacterium]
MINLNVNSEIRKKNAARCRERNVVLPRFSELREPQTVSQQTMERLKGVGLWDVDPVNLFRITWKNEPVERGGGYGAVNAIELPSSLTGVSARIIGLVGHWFPTGAHKVGATYGCLAPALISGNFDSQRQKAVWPSTGNYCRGGAYNSALLGCESIAILPEGMSRERFEWLKRIAGEVISTPGTESNVKEIFDACHELDRQRGDDVVIFNQFSELGNYLWHYEVTGNALAEVIAAACSDGTRYAGFTATTGSGGTLGAGDLLKQLYPASKIIASEALQCPTLLRNGFGDHRIEGIGDKHVPWVHNVRNTDMITGIDDQDCIDLMRVFNEPAGHAYLSDIGVDSATIAVLDKLGISCIANLLSAIKAARYWELGSRDLIVTVFTDSMQLYSSRIEDLVAAEGALTELGAARAVAGSIARQGIENALELTYYERLRVHNLKYYTWIEQQGKTSEELNAQWYDPEYWTRVQQSVTTIDEMIDEFNRDVAL